MCVVKSRHTHMVNLLPKLETLRKCSCRNNQNYMNIKTFCKVIQFTVAPQFYRQVHSKYKIGKLENTLLVQTIFRGQPRYVHIS